MSDTPSEPSANPTKRASKRARKPQPSDEVKHETQASEVPSPDASAAPESSAKRPKRRRGKKGKGGGEPARKDLAEEKPDASTGPDGSEHADLTHGDAVNEATQASPSSPKPPRATHQPARTSRHDPESLAKKAWKIYLAEVSEEGIALIGDQDAREISRRCFRLAEIFMDEQSRHT